MIKNGKKKIYLAGPLFTEAEIREREEQAMLLREAGFEVYNPIEVNAPGRTKQEIYEMDIAAMEQADFAVVNLDNFDSGTMAELGWFVAKRKPAFSIWTNWKFDVPTNLFIEGLANQDSNRIFKNTSQLIQYILNFYKDL